MWLETITPVLRKYLHLIVKNRHKLSSNGNVIHYTSLEALISMLTVEQLPDNEHEQPPTLPTSNDANHSTNAETANRPNKLSSLRLYDSIHLNDPNEGIYFFRNLHLSPKYGLENDGQNGHKSHAYMASFILPNQNGTNRTSDDNLIFWCAYGKVGEGCALSLSVPQHRLSRVLYGQEEIEATQQALIRALSVVDPILDVGDVRAQLAKTIRDGLAPCSYLYKDEAYQYEQECRFVLTESEIDQNKIIFEQQSPNLVIRHYVEHEDLAIEKLFVTDSNIRIGPCVPRRYNIGYALKALLRKAGLGYVEIMFSKIPYRKL